MSWNSSETDIGYTYPSEYSVKNVSEQVKILQQHFRGIRYIDEGLTVQPLPYGAEGYFAIPRWEKMDSTYNQAVERVIMLLAASRPLFNYEESELGPDKLWQHKQKKKMLRKLASQQKGCDIIIVPAQCGLRHRNRSVQRAREVFLINEFGLGAYEVGIILLTHPERLTGLGNLHIDCAGDEYVSDARAGGYFPQAPIFCFRNSKLIFGVEWIGRSGGVCRLCGSASGFIPS